MGWKTIIKPFTKDKQYGYMRLDARSAPVLFDNLAAQVRASKHRSGFHVLHLNNFFIVWERKGRG